MDILGQAGDPDRLNAMLELEYANDRLNRRDTYAEGAFALDNLSTPAYAPL